MTEFPKPLPEMTPEERLEDDMRRYLYDRTPDRRLKCLDQYRERKGLPSWHERNKTETP